MSKQNSSVDFYTERSAIVRVSFPEDYIKCQYCRFLKYEYEFKKYHCIDTGELILYPFETVGSECKFGYEELEKE